MRALAVYVSGQRAFGAAVAQVVLEHGHRLVGVAAPAYAGRDAAIGWAFGDDELMPWDRLRAFAHARSVPWCEAPQLAPHKVPDGTDVIVAAHSHAFIGRRTRARARLAAVGYHPSLLPLHRGRDAVRWTVRDRDRVAGGSVYHLTDNIDAGPLAAQDYVFVPPGASVDELWRELLFPLGVRLVARVLDDLAAGRIVAVPQDERCATWEPARDQPPLWRPELPELGAGPAGMTYAADPAALRG